MPERWTPAYSRLFDPDHELRGDEPACRSFAWLDLCHRASYESGTIIVDGVAVYLRRGEFLASVRYLAVRWNWDKMRVSRFLRILQEPNVDKLRKLRETPVGTVYRVVAYDTYANPNSAPRYTSDRQGDTPVPPERDTPGKPTGTGEPPHHSPVENSGRDTPSDPPRETTTRHPRDKVHTLDSSNTQRDARENSAGDLETWLGEFWEPLDGNPVLDDARTRLALFQHYGPPQLRARAWTRPDGSTVPESERPRILALALSGYASEGNRQLHTSEFAGMVRRVIRDESESTVTKPHFGDESARDAERRRRAQKRQAEREAERRRQERESDDAKRRAWAWYEAVDSVTRDDLEVSAEKRLRALEQSGAKITETTRRYCLLSEIQRRMNGDE